MGLLHKLAKNRSSLSSLGNMGTVQEPFLFWKSASMLSQLMRGPIQCFLIASSTPKLLGRIRRIQKEEAKKVTRKTIF
jgi:hypothetical protein